MLLSRNWICICMLLFIIEFNFKCAMSSITYRKHRATRHNDEHVNEYIDESKNANRKINTLNWHDRSHQHHHKSVDIDRNEHKKSQRHEKMCICDCNNNNNNNNKTKINRHNRNRWAKNSRILNIGNHSIENFNRFKPKINQNNKCPHIIAKNLCFNKGKCFKMILNDRAIYACQCADLAFGDRCEYKKYFV
ncbi:hypothetical protein DiNV_CH01M_ORF33 [Drosophila innubila nudivirus]|uniref:EGF-like domain-containing protein n=1 Tax=Drosophila innubila nudivirus TaxID=2057187 RepID=A0A2H4UX75_9VIRU|nr:hypothetical protein DiNV_CH01M_ORF33 [Drosophila innubila nudivirus]ATZ81514.1 hypothetical protein DiNV_CH01M_ORF33 [Drosophila innubila nudivirus]